MLTMLIHFCLVAVSMLIVSHFLPGIKIKSFGTAFIAALVLGLINLLVAPILHWVTAPINWLTLGLFAFVVNGVLLKLVAALVDDFEVKGWLSAILGAFLITLISSLLQRLLLG